MGGDLGPPVTVEGAVLALERTRDEIVLVGDRNIIEPLLAKHPKSDRISVVHASQVVGMHERPADTLKKTDSSIALSMCLVKRGEADAVVSAGHTGAAVASAIMKWRLVPGIRRPGIAWMIPTREKPPVIVDVGATVDCKPVHLYQFGVMGACLSEHVIGIKNPRVGLLTIGEESSKGNETTLKASQMLADSHLNFVGNAEGRDLVSNNFDVFVCDGFVGNIVLKFAEAMALWLMTSIMSEVEKSTMAKLGALAMKPAFRRFKRKLDYSEYGGAPLLGPDGICIICHGKSNAKAIANAIRVAGENVRHELNARIIETLRENRIIQQVAG
jgi:glycerol-3-phosphate acyltransferase PlsX